MRFYWNFHMCCTDMQSNTRVFPFTSRGQKTYAEALLRNFLIFFLLNSYLKKKMYWHVIDFCDSIIFRVPSNQVTSDKNVDFFAVFSE